jgi:tetratricopeptide (TPR) repeat protein
MIERACGAALVVMLAAGCGAGRVVRVVGGERVLGRFIAPSAYAAYARGAVAEADGDDRVAGVHYRRAAVLDPDGPQIWTRLGAVHCRLEQFESASRAFARAMARDASFQPAWHERAQCALRQSRPARALSDSLRAIELDPEREASLSLMLRAAEQARQDVDAEAWRREGRALRAETAQRSPEEMGSASALAAIDRALVARQLDVAKRLTRAAHLDPRILGIRALLVGRAESAMLLARRRLRAAPRDSDSRVLLALSADLAGRVAEFELSWTRLPALSDELSLAGRVMMVELLDRHIGPAAAAPWLQFVSQDKVALASDALARRLLARIDVATRHREISR